MHTQLTISSYEAADWPYRDVCRISDDIFLCLISLFLVSSSLLPARPLSLVRNSRKTPKMLATLPNELLLMLRPYMSLSSINALSQTSKFFRDLFDEEFLKLACHRRKLSRPLVEQGRDNAKERVPDYRTLVASMCAHLKTCKVKKCHAFLKFPVGQSLPCQSH